MVDIIKDISVLSTIPEKTLYRLFRKEIYCISEAISESIIKGEEMTELNIGIGTLWIKNVGNEVKYHFEPNELMEKTLSTIVNTGTNPLEDLLNDSLAKKFTDLYKDIC